MRRGFSLIEALVAVALLGVGIVASLGAISEMTRGEARTRQSMLLRDLAQEKMDELRATGELDFAPQDGTFEDSGHPDVLWSVETEPSSVENLTIVRLSVRENGAAEEQSIRLIDLVFQAPETTDGGQN